MCVRKEGNSCALLPKTGISSSAIDPRLAAPAGRDGCIGGQRFRDDDFRLNPGSTAINLSDIDDPATVGLATRTTQIDDHPDDVFLDAGFHYLPGTFADVPPLAADCDQDGCVRIDELMRAISIALDESPLRICRQADVDGDNQVSVGELVMAVNDSFCCTQHSASQ
jgi:hypothetical protein